MGGALTLEKQLDLLERDIEGVERIFKQLPNGLGELLMSDEFRDCRVAEFEHLDVDGSGTLEIQELYPLIEAIADVHPFAITYCFLCDSGIERCGSHAENVIQFQNSEILRRM